jgi:hypothetical protein
MKYSEVRDLTEIRALAAHLEVEPGLGNPFLLRRGILECLILIIRVHKIFYNGTRLVSYVSLV